MPFFDALITNPLRYLKSYLLGRGLLSLALIATWMIFGAGLTFPYMLMIGAGGALFTGFMRRSNQIIYEDQMVNLYRQDIAEHLKIAPEQVTRTHLREAAKGNDVIDQALQRQRYMNWIIWGTAALAGLATIALLSFGMPAALSAFFVNTLGPGLLGKALGMASVGIVSGLSSLVVYDGLAILIGQKTGVSKAAAHDRIVMMERGLARGQGVTKEQVYGVLVAKDPNLQLAISNEFRKPYTRMNSNEQAQVLTRIGVAQEMQTIAMEINAGRMRPAHLAYMISDTAPRTRVDEKAPAPSPARNFVKSLGLAPKSQDSYRAQVQAEREIATERGL